MEQLSDAIGFSVAKMNGGYRRLCRLTAIDSVTQLCLLPVLNEIGDFFFQQAAMLTALKGALAQCSGSFAPAARNTPMQPSWSLRAAMIILTMIFSKCA